MRRLLYALPLVPGAVFAQTTEIVTCARNPASDACQMIPPDIRPAPDVIAPQWSAGVAAGMSPRDGAPTGTYQALSLHRQLGRSYVQAGAIHYHTTLQQGEASATSDYGVGTVGFGGNYNGWVLDTYLSYGRQTFGDVRYPGGSRALTGATSSPYWGGGVSFGRMMALGSRVYVTPTSSVAYAWSRLLHPGGIDLYTSEPTWTTAGRLRLDWLPGHSRQTYLGLSVAGLWSNNATSLIGGAAGGGYGTGGYDVSSRHVHDVWSEVGAHASVAVTRSLRIEATGARTIGLSSGNATTVGLGLRRSF